MQSHPIKNSETLAHLSLGKVVDYKSQYAPELLQPVPRSLNRDTLPQHTVAKFCGWDIWNGYELSWLNPKGKPVVAILQATIPYDSPNLIESKSFKLYLNSFNGSRFSNIDAVKTALSNDLSSCAGADVTIDINLPDEFGRFQIAQEHSICIDNLDIDINHYQPESKLLKCNDTQVTESVHSHLLKSNCLITNQPDWATVEIEYTGKQIDHEGLLAYLISFRDHSEFHEQCVERIFCDIMQQCQPHQLSVYAKYTRRGGLDINPYRSTEQKPPFFNRHCRQ